MEKSEFIAKLKHEREQTEAVLSELSEDEMVEVELWPDWTIKDVLAHIAAWEAELVLGLAKARQGSVPRYRSISDAEVDKLNLRWHKENKKRPLERVLADFRGVRTQSVRQLDEMSAEDVSQPGRFKWLDEGSIAEWAFEYSIEHEIEHRVEIADWLKTKQTQDLS